MTKKTSQATAPASFEAGMTELAQLVSRMEAGELPLEESVQAYARGSELVQYCAAQLEKVEQQVRVLDKELLKPLKPSQASAADADDTGVEL